MCRNTISTLINLQKKNLESKLILQKYRANVVALYFLSLIFLLPRQRELERYAEVVGGGGVRRGRHYGDVGLMIEVGVQGEHAREGIVGRE